MSTRLDSFLQVLEDSSNIMASNSAILLDSLFDFGFIMSFVILQALITSSSEVDVVTAAEVRFCRQEEAVSKLFLEIEGFNAKDGLFGVTSCMIGWEWVIVRVLCEM